MLTFICSEMALYLLLFVFIIRDLSGVHSITTVSKVSVQRGKSIIIPCLYDERYTNHVKYWCTGYSWRNCKFYLRSDNRKTTLRASISDNTTQRIFTVTMTNLTEKDSGNYWCGVEIVPGFDDGERLQLSVTPGPSELSVDNQEIVGYEGGEITVQCESEESTAGWNWCRLGGSCVRNSGSLGGASVQIINAVRTVFRVTLMRLEMKHSGWYYCSMGHLQMPVHISVYHRPLTTQSPAEIQRTIQSTTAVTRAGFTGLKPNGTGDHLPHLSDQTVLLIALGILFFVIACGGITLVILKRKNHRKPLKDTVNSGNTQSLAGSADDVTYTTVFSKGGPSQQVTSREPDVTYSTVAGQRAASSETDVIYSTVLTKSRTLRKSLRYAVDGVIYSTVAEKKTGS